MTDDDGGVEESVTHSARIALTIAMQLGEKLSRAFEEAARQAQQRGAADAGALALRMDAERAAARQTVSIVDNSQWWDTATIQDVARLAETVATWGKHDPQIAAATTTIGASVQERYGVDVAALTLSEANGGPPKSARENADTVALLAAADRLDRATRSGPNPAREDRHLVELPGSDPLRTAEEFAYDGPDRRASLAAAMRSQGVPEELISSRMVVDASFSTPPRGATAPGRGKSLSARGGRRNEPHVERTGPNR